MTRPGVVSQRRPTATSPKGRRRRGKTEPIWETKIENAGHLPRMPRSSRILVGDPFGVSPGGGGDLKRHI